MLKYDFYTGLIFAIEWDHCDCCTPWTGPTFSTSNIFVLCFGYKNCTGSALPPADLQRIARPPSRSCFCFKRVTRLIFVYLPMLRLSFKTAYIDFALRRRAAVASCALCFRRQGASQHWRTVAVFWKTSAKEDARSGLHQNLVLDLSWTNFGDRTFSVTYQTALTVFPIISVSSAPSVLFITPSSTESLNSSYTLLNLNFASCHTKLSAPFIHLSIFI